MELDRGAGWQGESVFGSGPGNGHAPRKEHGPGAGTWDWDILTGDIVWSGLLYTLFGLDPVKDPASFDAWNRIIHPDDAAGANDRIRRALADHALLNSEYRIVRPDGEVRWINAIGEGIYDGDGRAVRMTGICVDVTRRRTAEEALAESERRYRAIADYTLDWEFWIGPAGEILYQSLSAERILGRPISGYSSYEAFLRVVMHPDDLVKRLGHLKEELAGKGPSEMEFRIIRPDGEVRWIHHVCRPIYDAGGVFLGTRGSNRDITDRKRAEAALRASEERLRFALETSHTGAWDLDLVGHTAYRSLEHDRIFGYPALLPEWTYEMFLNHVLPEDRPEVEAKFRHAMDTGGDWNFECRIRRADGEIRWIWAAGRHRDDATGAAGRMAGIVQDITGRHRVEEALRESEERFRVIAETSPVLLSVSSLEDGSVLFTNPAYEQAFGFERGEIIGRRATDLYCDDTERAAIVDILKREGQVRCRETRVKRRDGRPFWVESSMAHIRFGGKDAMLAASADITERKRAEKALSEAHERTRSILESIADTFYSLDTGWRFTVVNPAAEKAPFGRPASELIGKVIWDLYPNLVGTEIHRHYLAAAQHHTLEHYEAQSPLNGRWYEVFMQGRRDGVDVYMRDITERRQAVEALRIARDGLEIQVQERTAELKTSVAYNRSLIEAGLDPMVTIDPGGKISDVNAATVDMTGFSREELIGTDFSGLFTEPDKARAGYQKVFREGFVRDYPLGMRHRDGRITPVLYNATIFHDERGVTAGACAVARDISALKKAELDLEKAHAETRIERQRLYEVLETLPVYVCLLDADYKMPFANRYFRTTFGYSLVRTCYGFLFNRTEPCEDCESYKVMKTRAPHHWYWTGPNGRNYDIYDFPFTDTDGSPMILEMGIDITEQKNAEEAVRKAAVYNRSLIEASIDPMVTIRPDGKIGDVNAATVAATGLTREELIGTDFSDYFTEPGRAKAGYESAFRNGSVTDYDLGIRHRNGRVTPVLYNATVYRDASGKVTGVFAAARDITEQKRAEEALKKANEALEKRVAERTAELAGSNEELRAANEELAAAHEELNLNVGELTRNEELLRQKAAELTETLAEKEMLLSEIHHRVKNNLTAFISLLSLEGSYEESEAGKHLKKDLQNRARSMALIHETLYRTKKYSHVDMGVYLTTLIGQITTSYSTRRDVHVTVSADGVVLDLSRATPCGLIINELVTNSFKYAFPPGFDCASVRNGPCTIGVALESEDSMYRLTVSDNGAGLPAGINISTAKSLGLKLVNFLAKHQLQAAILVDTTAGTSIEFQFKKDPGLP